MKHGNSPMNKCITVEYVCVCIYICTVHRHIVWEHNKGGPRGLGPEISHLPSEKQNKHNFAEISPENWWSIPTGTFWKTDGLSQQTWGLEKQIIGIYKGFPPAINPMKPAVSQFVSGQQCGVWNGHDRHVKTVGWYLGLLSAVQKSSVSPPVIKHGNEESLHIPSVLWMFEWKNNLSWGNYQRNV